MKSIFTKKKKHRDYAEKAGLEKSHHDTARKRILIVSAIICFILTIFVAVKPEFDIRFTLGIIILIWTFGLALMIFILWATYYTYVDLKLFRRRLEIEEVFPDFLILASANIRSGMPIDKALWYAVRPRFGILAIEMEDVAKQTMSGVDLKDALTSFADRYDSEVLKRSVSLLIEGLEAGGEIGGLLGKIAQNIQENRILKREMSSSVITYVIFISFATIVAAPFLFALSGQLIEVMSKIAPNIDTKNVPGAFASFNFAKASISRSDFNIFAIAALCVSSFFSASIVATIRYGRIREGFKYIPIFIIVSVALYFAAANILSVFFSSFT